MIKKKELYLKAVAEKKYNEDELNLLFKTLAPTDSKVDIYQIKASIIYLSNSIEEVRDLVVDANKDCWQVMNWAQVKSDRT